MRYAQIRKMDISNGEGIGVALFVQGCHFRCKNCFNQETWDFDGGQEWTDSVEEQFLELADKPHIQRISILGGEPLAEENAVDICRLIINIIKRFGDTKKIWLYSGYTFEGLLKGSLFQQITLYLTDVLVDGRYDENLKDYRYKWAGSTNQRVIDVQASLKAKEVVLWKEK